MCYNSGEPGSYESGERETTLVCVGTREGRSGDCGRRARSWRCSLSRQGGNDNDNLIRKINNKAFLFRFVAESALGVGLQQQPKLVRVTLGVEKKKSMD